MPSNLKIFTLLPLTLAAMIAACGNPNTPANAPDKNAVPTAESSAAAATQTMSPPAETKAMDSMAMSTTVAMNLISASGIGADAGNIMLTDSPLGLTLQTHLKGLPPGEHGFHVHQNPDCNAAPKDGKTMAGQAAGEHYDPALKDKHAGPDGMGHAGDLPRLTILADGTATVTVIAAHLSLADVKNRALMLHAGRDDYGSAPGGERIACGVVR